MFERTVHTGVVRFDVGTIIAFEISNFRFSAVERAMRAKDDHDQCCRLMHAS